MSKVKFMVSAKRFSLGGRYRYYEIDNEANRFDVVVAPNGEHRYYKCIGYLGDSVHVYKSKDIRYDIFDGKSKYITTINFSKRPCMFCMTKKGILVFEQEEG